MHYYKQFEEPKILYGKFQVKPAFTFDNTGTYTNDAIWIIPKNDKYLLAILNSKVGWFLISHYCTQIQNGYQLIFKYLGRIPIRTINPADPTDKAMSERMVALVERMLLLHEEKGQGAGARATAEVDALVYRLYGLTEEEVKIVEGTAA